MYPVNASAANGTFAKAGYISSIVLGARTNSPFVGPHTTSIVATSSAIGSSDRRQKMTMATAENSETKMVSRTTL